VADHTWGRLRVLDGTVDFELGTDPPTLRRLAAGDTQGIPPGVVHRVLGDGPFRLVVDFLVPSSPPARQPGPDPEASG
jgi:quercetin dioxygenase-like cupin family protein